MATKLALSETHICNMALGRIGAERIVSFDDASEESVEAIQCRLHYAQTRDALIRSHWWRFARARAILSANTTDEPLSEWDYAYDLPTDFLRMKKPYEGVVSGETELEYTYSLEGKQILSNESSMKIRYIKRVTDPPSFDPLFVEVLVLQLALKMLIPIAGPGRDASIMRRELKDDLYGTPRQPGLMAMVRALDKEETNTVGRNNLERCENGGSMIWTSLE
jgi:hypothetical protein